MNKQITCPSCGQVSPPDARFCRSCGTNMADYEPSPSDQTPEFPSIVGPTHTTYTPPSGPPTPPQGTPQVRPIQKTQKKAKPFLISAIVVLLVLLAGGGGAYWFVVRKQPVSKAAAVPPPPPKPRPSPTLTTAQIAKKLGPSVVDISGQNASGGDSGTGMIISPNGEVLTNNHVIAGQDSLSATINGQGRTYQASVVGVDAPADVALIKLQDASGLTPVSFGNSGSLAVGTPVVAIGNALALQGAPTVSQGIVSALNRNIQVSNDSGGSTESLAGLIQTDAPISSGNSGGPLVDTTGHVVGMNTAGAMSSYTVQASNIGFAIPINNVKSLLGRLRNGENIGGGSGSTTTSTPPPSMPATPAGIVMAYWGDMNAGNFQDAWRLGGDNLQGSVGSESAFAQANASAVGTSSVTVIGDSGSTVTVLLTSGGNYFSGSYQVSNGAIQSANISRVSGGPTTTTTSSSSGVSPACQEITTTLAQIDSALSSAADNPSALPGEIQDFTAQLAQEARGASPSVQAAVNQFNQDLTAAGNGSPNVAQLTSDAAAISQACTS